MAADSYTEITSQSWFSRIGGAFKGILTGIVMVVAAFVLLFWNEGRAVKTYKTLKEGGKTVIPVSAERVDPVNNAKLVHMSGKAVTAQTLVDEDFGVRAVAIKLQRKVEMFQWQEQTSEQTKKKIGGGTETVTTYNYEKTWSASVIDSSRFKHPEGHANPGSIAYPSKTWTASPVTLGAFTLSASLVDQVTGGEPIVPDALPDALRDRAQLQGGTVHVGADPATPAVGDLRVRFEAVPPKEVSVMARQDGSSFVAHQTRAGGSINLLMSGLVPPDEMIQRKQDANRTLTWILRFVGWLVMTIGLAAIMKPLAVIADVLPILGRIVEAGTGFIAALLAAAASLFTISVAWLVFRPLLGILLIAVSVVLIVIVRKKVGGATPA